MDYFLSQNASLKWLETPSVYNIKTDELYELDDISFEFLKKCFSEKGCHGDDREFIDYCLEEGLLTTQKISLKRPPLIKSPVPSLRYLELQITDRCNLRCRHCYIGVKAPQELSVQQITDILREFEQMQGLRLMITGGEPLLHTDFNALNDLLPDFSIRKVLFTNGLLLTKDLLQHLNVEEIQISIDGLQKAHDALRGTGTFKKTVSAVKACQGAGIRGLCGNNGPCKKSQ